MNRRTFLQSLSVAAGIPAMVRQELLAGDGLFLEDADASLCKKKFQLAASLSLQKKPLNEVIVEIGKTFLGTEYVANVLEVPGDERLVVNLRALDCVTFYENSLVLARCIKKNKTTFDDYRAELQYIRYRGGVVDKYPSRLHYTSDYFYDNEKKGVWKNVSKEIGGAPFVKTINFMSTHPDQYRQIKESPEFAKAIAEQEQEITKRPKFYVPKDKLWEMSGKLMSGDILGITTDIEGLDVSHTGIAVKLNGRILLMHAPIVGKKVEITRVTLAEHLARNKKQTGVMVVRATEPT